MRAFGRLALGFLAFLAVLPLASAGAAEWSEAAVRALTSSPDAPSTVQTLIRNNLSSADDQTGVCSYAFVDLGGNGSYRLVASVDRSGRDFCNLVVVMSPSGAGYDVQTIDAWRADEVADIVVSLEGTGAHQLAVPTPLSNYENGPDCVATWPAVYALRGGALVEASRDYAAFYNRELSEKSQALGSAGADDACRVMETDKLRRVLGVAPDAGLSTAQSWMRSTDPTLRAKAARIFADIGGTPAASGLKILARDRDGAVAETANAGLVKAGIIRGD